jgi:sulfonate transport system permease protein
MSSALLKPAAHPAAPSPGPAPAPASKTIRIGPRAHIPRRRFALAKPVPGGILLGPALLLLGWVIGAWANWIDPRVLPAPWTVAQTFWQLASDGRLESNFATSAVRAGEGLGFGTAAGVVVALLSGLTRTGEYLLDGLVQIKRAVPVLALIPLLVMWLGIDEPMKVAIIAISVFIPIYMQLHFALRGIEARYIELACVLRLNYLQFLRWIVLPGALAGFLLGLRLAVAAAWIALVVVEQINATSGIGYMISLAGTYGQTDVIIAGLVVYAILGLTAEVLVRLLAKALLPWQRTFAG